VVPAWINLPFLPRECWSAKAIAKIASCVGKPISTDKLTTTRARRNYARVLVELDLSKDQTLSFPVNAKDGVLFEQKVEYEYVPHYCSHCKYIGHSLSNCGKHVAHVKGKKINGEPEKHGKVDYPEKKKPRRTLLRSMPTRKRRQRPPKKRKKMNT
ncbi:Zinc knuckle (CCHC-type) family protein, partial [Striga hermonthica]